MKIKPDDEKTKDKPKKDLVDFDKIRVPMVDKRRRYMGDALTVRPDSPVRGQIHIWDPEPCSFYRTGNCGHTLEDEIMYPHFDAPFEMLQFEIYQCDKCKKKLARESWDAKRKAEHLDRLAQINTEIGYPCRSDYRDRFQNLKTPEDVAAVFAQNWEALHQMEVED